MATSKESAEELGVVGIDVIKKAGVNVNTLVEKLVNGVAAELTTYYYYTILRMHLTGLEGGGSRKLPKMQD